MNLFRNTSEYLKCRSFVIQSVNVRKNNTFAVNLLSTVDRKHGIIDIDLIRKPNIITVKCQVMVVIIYNWKEQVGFTLMVENPPFFHPNCNSSDENRFSYLF